MQLIHLHTGGTTALWEFLIEHPQIIKSGQLKLPDFDPSGRGLDSKSPQPESTQKEKFFFEQPRLYHLVRMIDYCLFQLVHRLLRAGLEGLRRIRVHAEPQLHQLCLCIAHSSHLSSFDPDARCFNFVHEQRDSAGQDMAGIPWPEAQDHHAAARARHARVLALRHENAQWHDQCLAAIESHRISRCTEVSEFDL